MKNLFRLRLMWLFMLFCMIPLWALSQNITVKGIVKDGAGESVIGASVLQKGTTNGTITDFEGGFTLNLPSNSVIECGIFCLQFYVIQPKCIVE